MPAKLPFVIRVFEKMAFNVMRNWCQFLSTGSKLEERQHCLKRKESGMPVKTSARSWTGKGARKSRSYAKAMMKSSGRMLDIRGGAAIAESYYRSRTRPSDGAKVRNAFRSVGTELTVSLKPGKR